jgi:hypothetical protein
MLLSPQANNERDRHTKKVKSASPAAPPNRTLELRKASHTHNHNADISGANDDGLGHIPDSPEASQLSMASQNSPVLVVSRNPLRSCASRAQNAVSSSHTNPMLPITSDAEHPLPLSSKASCAGLRENNLRREEDARAVGSMLHGLKGQDRLHTTSHTKAAQHTNTAITAGVIQATSRRPSMREYIGMKGDCLDLDQDDDELPLDTVMRARNNGSSKNSGKGHVHDEDADFGQETEAGMQSHNAKRNLSWSEADKQNRAAKRRVVGKVCHLVCVLCACIHVRSEEYKHEHSRQGGE